MFYDFKALIVRSGKQKNGFIISKQAVRNMYQQNDTDSPVFEDINHSSIIGVLLKTEIITAEDGEVELYGYYKRRNK